MSPFKRYSILAALLAGAMACYAVGLVSGAVVFLIAGVALEISFWLGLFRPRR